MVSCLYCYCLYALMYPLFASIAFGCCVWFLILSDEVLHFYTLRFITSHCIALCSMQ
jgi:hypothetical protein